MGVQSLRQRMSQTPGPVPAGVQTLRRRLTPKPPARRVGRPKFAMERRRGELLAGVYIVGDIGALFAWLADPRDIANRAGMAVLIAFVFCCAIAFLMLRDHLLAVAGDLAIVGSLVLINIANAFSRAPPHVPLFMPFYIWVGFASPLWFPRRRAVLYVALAVGASGAAAIVSGNAATTAVWVVTIATLIAAFVTVDSLRRAMIERERLAAVGEMASVVSHELRNPLGALANAVYLVRYAVRSGLRDEIDQHLSMAEREIDKAIAIIDQLVAFVRPRQPEVGPVPVAEVVAEVLETTPTPPAVEARVDVGTVWVLADRGHLVEVLVNLISNAFDATAKGGVVQISGKRTSHHVAITIEDDGCGIDRTLSERIFEPFFTTKHTGTGLGLAIVRRLVEVNHGMVAVDSHLGHGTRFTVTLPQSAASSHQVPPGTASVGATGEGGVP
jgi:signal transduction histidine kinase